MTVRRIDGPQGALHLDEDGDGEPGVLFVHSLAGNASQWEPQLDHLRRHDRAAVALDLRGHGRSDPPANEDLSIKGMAEDVAAVARATALHDHVVVGHSLGALVAIEHAAAHPRVVRGLVLVDPAGDMRRMPPDEATSLLGSLDTDYDQTIEAYWSQILDGGDPLARERVMADLRDTPAATVVGALHRATTYDPITPLEAYRENRPVLDVVTPLNDASYSLHRLTEGLVTKRFEDTGHWLQLDAPGRFNALLDRFLDNLPG